MFISPGSMDKLLMYSLVGLRNRQFGTDLQTLVLSELGNGGKFFSMPYATSYFTIMLFAPFLKGPVCGYVMVHLMWPSQCNHAGMVEIPDGDGML